MAPPYEERRPSDSDSALLERARTGDGAAFETLWLRHVEAATEVAERVSTAERAPDLVAEARTRTSAAVLGGGGPEDAFRPYLLATVRRLAAGAATDGGIALVGTDRDAAWAAWQSLPGEERDLLWRLVVHEQSPAALAPLLGTTAEGVAAHARRAGDRLRRAYLADLLTAAPEAGCRAARRQFGAYARDALTPQERDRVDAHLDTCDRCPEAVAGLVDVTELIRVGVGPHLLPGLFGADGGGADGAAPESAGDQGSADLAGADLAGADSGRAEDDGLANGTGLDEGADPASPGARSASVEDADDDHALEVAAIAAPVMTRAEARARAAAAAGPRRLDVPLVLVGAAALVAVAGIAVLFWLFGGGTAPPHGTARPPTSPTRPPPGTALPPLAGVVTVPPMRSSATVLSLRPVAVGDGSAMAPFIRPATSTTASTGTSWVAARPAPSSTRSSRPASRPNRTFRPHPTRPPTGTRRPQATPVPPAPPAIPPAPAVTPARSTIATPSVTPGAPVVLGFEPSTDRGYTASVVAPPGWLITSVRDVRGRHELEHVRSPTQTFEGALRPGPLVVEVTPQPGARAGTLFTWFTDRRGALLPGSGGHPLP